MSTAETLTNALDELRQRGWHQGSTINAQGNVCAIGALRFSLDGGRSVTWGPQVGDMWGEFVAARDILLRALPDGQASVPVYNDAHSTSYEDIEMLFKRAIHAAEAAES